MFVSHGSYSHIGTLKLYDLQPLSWIGGMPCTSHTGIFCWALVRYRARSAYYRYQCPHCVLRRLNLTLDRSEEHTSELQSLMRISYAVFCLTKKIKQHYNSMIEFISCQTIQLNIVLTFSAFQNQNKSCQ